MNVDSMDQSHRETKVKYETDLANLREQVAVQHRHLCSHYPLLSWSADVCHGS